MLALPTIAHFVIPEGTTTAPRIPAQVAIRLITIRRRTQTTSHSSFPRIVPLVTRKRPGRPPLLTMMPSISRFTVASTTGNGMLVQTATPTRQIIRNLPVSLAIPTQPQTMPTTVWAVIPIPIQLVWPVTLPAMPTMFLTTTQRCSRSRGHTLRQIA